MMTDHDFHADLKRDLEYRRNQAHIDSIQAETNFINLINMTVDAVTLLNPTLLPVAIALKTSLLTVYGLRTLLDNTDLDAANSKYRAVNQAISTVSLAVVATLPYAQLTNICLQTFSNLITSIMTQHMAIQASVAVLDAEKASLTYR